mgnify:CR=1 FL=1
MFCISLNYKRVDEQIRNKASLSEDVLKESGCGVLLNTCNRMEFYGVDFLYDIIDKYFSKLKKYILIYDNSEAVNHLFKVACGLDSMLLGEDEILGQVKAAYTYSLENGYTNYEINTIFKAAITCAKRIKTDTLLSKSSVSVATLTADLCRKYKDGRKTVLVIGGSGDIGNKIIKNLISAGDFEIYATVHKHDINNQVKQIDYKERYEYINQADIVISATKSPHFTIMKDEFESTDKLFIDLAVPRDIDTSLENVITFEEIAVMANKNRTLKQDSVSEAMQIIDEDIDALQKELLMHRLMPLEVGEELKHFIYDFRNLSSADEFKAFAAVFERMEKKK